MNKTGEQSERRAERYLVQQGLSIIHRNYRCRFGEIDLIAEDRDCLVFIEVRYRRSQVYGGALASITARKRARILRTAQLFLVRHPSYQHWPCRFDVLAMGATENGKDCVQWLPDAFTS